MIKEKMTQQQTPTIEHRHNQGKDLMS